MRHGDTSRSRQASWARRKRMVGSWRGADVGIAAGSTRSVNAEARTRASSAEARPSALTRNAQAAPIGARLCARVSSAKLVVFSRDRSRWLRENMWRKVLLVGCDVADFGAEPERSEERRARVCCSRGKKPSPPPLLYIISAAGPAPRCRRKPAPGRGRAPRLGRRNGPRSSWPPGGSGCGAAAEAGRGAPSRGRRPVCAGSR